MGLVAAQMIPLVQSILQAKAGLSAELEKVPYCYVALPPGGLEMLLCPQVVLKAELKMLHFLSKKKKVVFLEGLKGRAESYFWTDESATPPAEKFGSEVSFPATLNNVAQETLQPDLGPSVK